MLLVPPRRPVLAFVLLCLSGTVACDALTGSRGGELQSGASGGSASNDGSAKAGQRGGASKGPAAPAVDGARFAEDIRKRPCELLTAKMVATALEVPEAQIKRQTMMGCFYSWEGGGEELAARILMIRAHKTETGAASWFAKATRDVSAAELREQMLEVGEPVKETPEEVDNELKRKAVDQLLKTSVAGVGAAGIHYETVADVGEDAKFRTDDGNLWVRVDNLTLAISAFKGPPMPAVDRTGLDLDALGKRTQSASKKWMADTVGQRKRDSIKVAQAVIGGLREREAVQRRR